MRIFVLLMVLGSLIACKNNNTSKEVNSTGIPEIDKLSAEILQNPNNPALYAARSTFYSNNELFKEAVEDAEKALGLDSSNIDYYRLLGNAYFDNNQSLPAIKTLEKAITRFPKNEFLYLSLSEMQLLVQQYQAALISLDMLFKVAPASTHGQFLRGQIFKEMGDTLQALHSFQLVVEQDADFIDAYIQLGSLSEKLNKPIALRYLDNALRIDSTNYDALERKAWYYHNRSQYEEAVKAYEKAIIAHSLDPDLNYNLALMYMEWAEKLKEADQVKSKYENAYLHFTNATKFDPQFADAYYYKGLAAEKLGKKQAALADFNTALNFQGQLQWTKPADIEAAIKRVK